MLFNKQQLIESAYRKTRSAIYYERANLDARFAFAYDDQEFFESKLLRRVAKIITRPRSKQSNSTSVLEKLVKKVHINLCPKSFDQLTVPSSASFQSNVDWAPSYRVNSFNYFIKCPPELYVLATLWAMVVGPLLDENLPSSCYGWRLHQHATDLRSLHLFKCYVPEYGKWRNQAIDRVFRTVQQDKQNAILVNLDLRQFYYHVHIDWKALAKNRRSS